MTKSEFILSLSEALALIPRSERVRVLEYYEEMIDDRIESGMSEEEAVAALGSIDEILKEAAPEAVHECTNYSESVSSCAKFIVLHDPIETLVANSACAELHVRSEPLPDGVTARVDYNLSDNEQCACSLSDGRLKVLYKQVKQRSFSFRSLISSADASITITLSNPALVRGEISAISGSVDLSQLVFTDSLDAHTASGDLDARDIAVQCKCKLQTASGDITGHNLTCGELLEVHTASGDMETDSVRAGKIDAATASGDLKISEVEADKMHAHSASGDIEIHGCKSQLLQVQTASGDLSILNAECSELIDLHSSNGDISLRDASCSGSIQLSSTNGDIKGTLSPAGAYTYSASARLGDVKIPNSNGSHPVHIQSITGDIIFREESWDMDSTNHGTRHHRPHRNQQ